MCGIFGMHMGDASMRQQAIKQKNDDKDVFLNEEEIASGEDKRLNFYYMKVFF